MDVIVEGFSAIDESMLTGEHPRRQAVATRLQGAVNGHGMLKMRLRVGSETALQIIRMVEGAGSKAPIQRLADVISSYFVPAVMVGGGCFAGWMIGGSGISGPCEHHRCAGHRLPLRARACDSDGYHGGHRARRRAGHTDTRRRTSGG